MTGSLSEATRKFIEASTWLTEVDQPGVVAMQLVAAQVDKDGPMPALMGQYGVAYRALVAKAPKAAGEVDPLAAALEAAGGVSD